MWELGISVFVNHNEVAPAQLELSPIFCLSNQAADQNVLTMEVMDWIAMKHELKVLFHEKPFANINGSGKHNNWSIATTDGVNLLNPEQLNKASGNDDAFGVVMAAIIAAVNDHGDLMRMSIACPGNEFRLGACEAPPAIISTYLGDDMTNYMKNFKKNKKIE